ncbi:MAG: hypothetical protein PWR27_347 [Petroclostridium sp.]|jgi:hypothetical protein|nr:DUF3789 domain-containing protein [Petroclostridium xylanilyticum]MBZ4646387.1 hypothetical protein [Clostridia bacterium]MDK2809638.1 hypothetical protein [Petroclostridium sp.]
MHWTLIFLSGVFVGAIMGVLVTGLCAAAKERDRGMR